jgi:hypothetical protein
MTLIHKIPPNLPLQREELYPSLAKRGEGRFSDVRVNSLLSPLITDELVKSRHSRAGGNPESAKILKRLDSRFHGNDGISHFQTFYEIIITDTKH